MSRSKEPNQKPIPTHYAPPAPWRPNALPEDLVELVEENRVDPSTIRQYLIARAIRSYWRKIMPRYNKQNYRAAYAIDNNGGSCIATTEGLNGIYQFLNLGPLGIWGADKLGSKERPSNHGAVLWPAHNGIRYTDYTRDALWIGRDALHHLPEKPRRQQVLIRTILETAAGRAFVNADSAVGDVEWEPIVGPAGKAREPFERSWLILPGDEAVVVLGAIGDRVRYRRNHPAIWEAIGGEIESLIPQPYDKELAA